MKKILILEGDDSVRNGYIRYFEAHGCIFDATNNNTDAITLIVTRGEEDRYDAAIIDGCLKKRPKAHELSFDTEPTIKMLKQVGTPIILAASGHDVICEKMMSAGCTHSVEGDKPRAHQIIAEGLKLVPKEK